jgi:hypothetical protein
MTATVNGNGVEQSETRELTIAPIEQPQQARSISPIDGALISLAGDINQIKQARNTFERLKHDFLLESDFQSYTQSIQVDGRWEKQTKKFIKKTGWSNIALAFGINIEPIGGAEMIDLSHVTPGRFAIKYKVKATAPNGRYMIGVGSCDSHEDRFAVKEWKTPQGGGKAKQVPTGEYSFEYNDVDSTAMTRATSRAISFLVGGGEVSAEEIDARKINATEAESQIEYLPQDWQDRLASYAKRAGPDGQRALADMLLDTIGTKFLTKDQATDIGKVLAQLPGLPKMPEAQPAEATAAAVPAPVEAQVSELTPDDVRNGPLSKARFATILKNITGTSTKDELAAKSKEVAAMFGHEMLEDLVHEVQGKEDDNSKDPWRTVLRDYVEAKGDLDKTFNWRWYELTGLPVEAEDLPF